MKTSWLRALAFYLFRAGRRGLGCVGALVLDLAGDLDRALDLDRARGCDLECAGDLALDHTSALARVLDRAFGCAGFLAFALDRWRSACWPGRYRQRLARRGDWPPDAARSVRGRVRQ